MELFIKLWMVNIVLLIKNNWNNNSNNNNIIINKKFNEYFIFILT